MTIQKLLIANRGEIARRIMATAHELGIATVAVYSDADRRALFVADAHEAVRIGPAAAAESYLSIEALLKAAQRTGADAVHPGYGFLSENAGFARAVIDAGLTWVGPSPEAIDAMGSKAAAKALMVEHGVPTIPGYSGEEQSREHLEKEALALGFPILLKASAGGGGKGMRIVREAAELKSAIEGAQREGLASFGDDRLLIERYVDKPRHVEFQILGDTHGNLVHLFDRECSVQRRHQKVLEEAPSPALDDTLRTRMAEAAVQAGKAIGYSSAGTVEFILAPDGAFYFLEINTRLQVEHPVTEMVTGLDLVALQLAVANGAPLPFQQSDLAITGHAVEARVYAEDPSTGFLPATGKLLDWHIPLNKGVRVDSGVDSGCEVSVHYDPMLAKVIAYGENRQQATQRLNAALRASRFLGVTTNRRFLCDVLSLEAWRTADLHTHFIDEHQDALITAPNETVVTRAAAVATAAYVQGVDSSRQLLPALSYGWRNNRSRGERYTWVLAGDEAPITVDITRKAWGEGWQAVCGDVQHDITFVQPGHAGGRVEVDGVISNWTVCFEDESAWVHDGANTVVLAAAPIFPDNSQAELAGGCIAPMPGKVLALKVSPGQSVEEGDVLVILEAMKMEHTLSASRAATVAEVLVAEGEQVDGGAPLVLLEDPT